MRPPDPSHPGTRVHDGAIDDVHLMGLVAIEDVAAFETLYRAYYPRLARFLRGMLRQSASSKSTAHLTRYS